MNKSVVMQIRCENEDCGMVSAYRMFDDGSFSRILEACGHTKRIPSREKIIEKIKKTPDHFSRMGKMV